MIYWGVQKKVYVGNIEITILGACAIFLMTCLGAAMVFFFKNSVNQKIYSLCLGFASGLMVAASIWSLIVPALEGASDFGKLSFLPVAVGIVVGVGFLILIDLILPKIFKKKKKNGELTFSKSSKLFLAVTIHNIPEGLAVGVAYGSAFLIGGESFFSALMIAIGIGVQNFPEGLALALPLKETLKSKKKAFFLTVLSATVEPIMVVLGIFLSTSISRIMPWLLSFSAGCMLYVVCEELLPDSQISSKHHIGTWGFIIGFVIMMILDVALG